VNRYVINLGTIKKGGGQSVALNFLSSFKSLNFIDEFSFIVPKNSDVKTFCIKNNLAIFYTVSQNPILRILQELVPLSFMFNRYNIKAVYTYFGFGLFITSIKQVIGSADSNLFYPKLDFWSEYSGLAKLKKKIIDNYRILGLRIAHAVIFENEALKIRATEIYKLKNTFYVPPSIKMDAELTDEIKIERKKKEKIKLLFLCGWQLHKNILLIPKLAHEIKKNGLSYEILFTSYYDESNISLKFQKLVEKYGVAKYIKLIGPVKKSNLPELYNCVDAVMLLSKLESFSNNIIEAWYFKKPLFVTNSDWALSICGEAAFYVERDDACNILESVRNVINNKTKSKYYLDHAKSNLENFPSIKQKTIKEINILRSL